MDADRVAGLTTVVERLADAETERDAHERTARAAADLLSAEVGVVASADGDRVRPEWVVADELFIRPPVSRETSVAGETIRSGEVVVVDDLADRAAVSAPGELRSVVSAPLGEESVVQALSATSGAFSRADAQTAELLAAQASQALRRIRTEREARRERDEFVALFDSVVDGALRYRLDGDAGEPVVERVNPAFVDQFGVEADEVVGGPITRLPFVDADTAEMTAAVEGRRVEQRVTRRTAAGRRRFLMRTVPVDEPGDDTGVGYVIYTDIEAAVSRAERLRQQNDRLDEFASTVTHDLRNPLEVARGYLATARGEDDVDLDGADPLVEVNNSLDRMDRIIEDVLAMAREGQAVVETEPVPVGAVAREAWDNVATGDAALRVSGEVTLDADRPRLTQLFENLFRNSVEHGATESGPSSDDGETPVTVVVGPLTGRRGFYVEDDGPGIAPDRRERALEPGYTTAEDGTGLGLSLVERIAGAHGWAVDLGAADSGGLRVAVHGADDGSENPPVSLPAEAADETARQPED